MFPDDFDPDAAAASEGLFGLPCSEADASVVVLGVPWEATTSYRRGTARGPAAVARASLQVDLYDLETGEPWRHGITLAAEEPDFELWNEEACEHAVPVIEAGGVDPDDPASVHAAAQVDALSARRDALVAQFTKAILDSGRIPAILGGDHSVPLGAIRAAAAHTPGLGILHVDAHADLRDAFEGFRSSHASILRNVLETAPGLGTVVQVGLRDVGAQELAYIEQEPRLRSWFDPDVAARLADGTSFRELARQMIEPLPQNVWVTWDIDGLDPSLCPNTGTPVPGGLSWREALVLLRELAASGRRIVGFDLVEVAVPSSNVEEDAWDAIVGARLLYKLAGWALKTCK
jgi:agmatinase